MRVGRLFRLTEEQMLGVRGQFAQNADRAVFLGRFIALLRIFAGPLAGAVKMPCAQCLLWNALGALAWASAIVSLAYFAGRLVPLPQLIQGVAQFTRLALVLVVCWITLFVWKEARPPQIQE